MDTAKLIARRISEGKIPASYGKESPKISRPSGYNKSTLDYAPLPHKRGNRWGVKEVSTNPQVIMNNHSVQNLNIGEQRKCLNCGKILPDDKYHLKMKNQVCNNNCRKELTLKTMEEERRVAIAIANRTKRHNRKCTICGKPCWPNYFYCTPNFHQVTDGYFEN